MHARPPEQAHGRRLPGHHDLAHQPRRHRHRALGAAPHEGPGLHHRRRRPRVPGRVPGRVARRPSRSSRSARRSRSRARTTTASSRAPARASSSRRCTSCSSGSATSTRTSSRRCASPTSPSTGPPTSTSTSPSAVDKTARVQELINSFRVRGHLMADIDPLEYVQRTHPDLEIASHGLTFWDLDREFVTGGFGDKRTAMLRDILGVLRDSYCRTIGIEYMHIQDPVQRQWFQEQGRAQVREARPRRAAAHPRQAQRGRGVRDVPADQVRRPEALQPRGRRVASSPLLDEILQGAAKDGLDEVAIGMAHRGRLNVLTNIARQDLRPGVPRVRGHAGLEELPGSGDVKYHLGTEGTFTADDGDQIPVYLAANPSHLEAVDGVLEGIVRAKQDRKPIGTFSTLPILVHGDAALAGQGVVVETHADVAAARLPHRRHDPRRRQQPGRLHHRAGRRALVDLLDGCRQDHPGADLPRERRRPRGRRARRGARVRATARSSTATS